MDTETQLIDLQPNDNAFDVPAMCGDTLLENSTDPRGPFYQHDFTLISAQMSNHHIQYKVWDEITYLFPNFNGAAVEVWEWVR